MAGEENVESVKPLDQALGIVKAVDADDRARGRRGSSTRFLTSGERTLRRASALKSPRLDADGKTADPGLPPFKVRLIWCPDVSNIRMSRIALLRS